ncbi:MAG: ATP-binding cassette domain-containing protein, partial [Dechloromonas sp.]|nr:ATP-binding cassette domain-containing protein [Dechloromonas sp.]
PSLSVHEHFTLTAGIRPGAWTVERVYDTFPRLAERRQNRGNQLSGGEQQMLAIGRALLLNPSLLVLDEPSEGLSPLVVEQLQGVLRRLVDEEGMSLLVVEQNFRLAVALSERMLVMVSGEIVLDLPSCEFAANAELQERYLGVGH